jgi:sterol desaturase/sphingolipid hydroxylase (fatty acid hydroxylase superfamily)
MDTISEYLTIWTTQGGLLPGWVYAPVAALLAFYLLLFVALDSLTRFTERSV